MEWKEVRLGDIVSIKSGLAYKGAFIGKGENILLGMGCVSFKDKFLFSGARPYEADCDDKYCVEPGDIVLATRQQSDNLPILAMPAIIPPSLKAKKIIYGTNLYKVENHSEVTNDFLFWQLKTPDYIDYISSVKTGSVVRMVTKKNVEDYVFRCPPKEVRDRISKLLWGLDLKIELNNKINADLEEMAQAIFKNWFVDFEPFKDGKFVDSELGMIPEGWKVGGLFDIAEIFDKKRKPLSGNVREKMDKIYPYYGATSCMDYVDDYIFDGIYTLIGEDGSVVKENGLPYMQYVWGKMWVNNHAHILQGKNGYSTEMIHALLSIINIKFLVTGAVQAKLSQGNMQKILVAIPPKIVLDEIRPVIDNLYSKIRINTDENSRLSLLRDTLLPRLMSGELEVPD